MGACLLVAITNRQGYALIGRAAPFAFETEIILSALVAVAVMCGSALWPRDAADEARLQQFFARTQAPRPPQTSQAQLPAPLGVIGSFTLLIGALRSLLAAFPQSLLHRGVTLAAALVLLFIGGWMKRRA